MRLLAFIHRWLGIGFCLIFFVWFASGIVMVFKRMPEYDSDERLARLPVLTPERIRVTLHEAGARAGLSTAPTRARVTSVGGRAAYQFLSREGWRSVFADDGEVLASVDPSRAVDIARVTFPESTAPRFVKTIAVPDQWTFGVGMRTTGPLHRIALGDAAGTEVYVASTSGDVVMKTDRDSRFWGYVGAVLHWIYFTPLRQQSERWSALIIYGSLAGCLTCVLGLILGVARISPSRGYFQDTSISPYRGWLRWHHYFGLVFGVVTFTWLFSGMLSMTPWNWSPGAAPLPRDVDAVRGGPLDLDAFTVAAAEAVRALPSSPVRELELQQFLGSPFYEVRAEGYQQRPPQLVNGAGPAAARTSFMPDELATALGRIRRDGPTEIAWLTEYDNYYYDRSGRRGLPVLRAKFADAEETWLYLSARDGQLVRREVSRSRLERWLYHGLHSLDFPFLYRAPLAWYILIIGLSAGGVLLSGTSVVIAWRDVSQKLRRGLSQR